MFNIFKVIQKIMRRTAYLNQHEKGVVFDLDGNTIQFIRERSE